MKWLYSLIFVVMSLVAFDKVGCINNGGLFVEGKCLIDGRAVCIDGEQNQNVTYGYVDTIPNFAKGYVEKGDFNVSGIAYSAKINGVCRELSDTEITLTGVVKLLAKKLYDKEGTFIHYGNTAFEWAYIPKSGKFIGFLKQSDNGYLQYVIVSVKDYGIKIDQNSSSIVVESEEK